MDLSVQQLRMLREVSIRGTIAAAADGLGYTPSAVSQQLGGIEKSTGIAVLERVGRNVQLTDEGRELVRHAEMVIRHLEQAEVALERMQTEATGRLEIAVMESVANSMLGPLIVELTARHPALDVRTREAFGEDPTLLVRNGEVDACFTVDHPAAPMARREGLDYVGLFRDWFRLALPEQLARDREVGPIEDIAGFADERWIAPPWDDRCGRVVIQSCRLAGFEPDIAHSIDDYPASLELVAAGIGVALVPDLALRYVPESVRIVNPAVPICRTVDLAVRASSRDRPAIAALLEVAAAVVARSGLDHD